MQFTTAKKQNQTISKAEKLISHLQIEAEETAYRCMKAEKLLLISHLIDFHPCLIEYLNPIFVSDSAIDFLLKNYNQINNTFTILNFIKYGKIYRHVVEIFKLNPKNLKDLKRMYLNVKSCNNDKQIS